MGKYQVKESVVAYVGEKQSNITRSIEGEKEEIERCPYCGHMVIKLVKPDRQCGETMVIKTKCSKCGFEILIPISFRGHPI